MTTSTATRKGISEVKELEMGTKIELEHTDDSVVARQIAEDHLKEIPDYYTRLKRMEKEAAKSERRALKGTPSKADISGIDTPTMGRRGSRLSKKTPRITPRTGRL